MTNILHLINKNWNSLCTSGIVDVNNLFLSDHLYPVHHGKNVDRICFQS